MPPKRGGRGGRAASRTPGPRESPSTGVSTSYGSPAPNTTSRTLNSGSVVSAIGEVLDNVNSANANGTRPRVPVVNARMLRLGVAGGDYSRPGEPMVTREGLPPGGPRDVPPPGGWTAANPDPRRNAITGPRVAHTQTANAAQGRLARPGGAAGAGPGSSEDEQDSDDAADSGDDRARMPPPRAKPRRK